QRIDVALTGEVVGGGGQSAVRALPERRMARMEGHALIGNLVKRADRRSAGIVIVELPRRENSVFVDAGLDLDDPCGSEITPGELLGTSPDQLDRFAGGLGKPRG